MKTGNVGIRNLADINVGDIDVYGTDRRKKNNLFVATEKVKLRIGVFFDGTGNNRFNSDDTYYKQELSINEETIPKEGKKKVGTSYWNSYSNIALLHDLYEEKRDWDDRNNVLLQNLQLKFYIQGIGTFEDKEDDALGLALGEGEYGVVRRVNQACDEIVKSIARIFLARETKNKIPLEIVSIQFDVFGFSRGAAAARHFCNEVLKTKSIAEIISKRNNEKTNTTTKVKPINSTIIDNVEVVKPRNQMLSPTNTGCYLETVFNNTFKHKYPQENITIEFLGIFDTVISQMLEKYGIIDLIKDRKKFYDSASNLAINASLYRPKTIIKEKIIELSIEKALKIIKENTGINPDDIPKINPSLSYTQIKKVFHIVANNEWRENFPLTAVSDAKYYKEISMLGAHSDIGGGYANTTVEKNILHFMDVSVKATDDVKQKMKIFRDELEQWYLDNQYCKNDGSQNEIEWIETHHVLITLKHSISFLYDVKDKSFMGNETEIINGDSTYTLIAKHYELHSTRIPSNKLSLVSMNVMKHIAQNYGGVPFNLSVDKTEHSEEYVIPKELDAYCEVMKKIAESGWKKKPDGSIEEYKDLYLDFKKKIYNLDLETHRLILNKFVHLSANYNKPLFNLLDHTQFAYTNVPQFNKNYENDYQNPPYKRLFYTPKLSTADKNNSH